MRSGTMRRVAEREMPTRAMEADRGGRKLFIFVVIPRRTNSFDNSKVLPNRRQWVAER